MFALGYYFVKYKIDVKKLDKIKIRYVGLLFTWLIMAKLNHKLFFLYIICGVCFYYQISGKIRESKVAGVFLWCSQFTFFIYAFHEYYEAMAKKIFMMMIPQSGIVQLLEFFLLPIMIVVCCIIAGAILKQKIPFLYDLICGQR